MKQFATGPVSTYHVPMKNVTLAIEDSLVEEGRKYADAHGTTLNDLVRTLLERTVKRDANAQIEVLLRLMDEHSGDSRGQKWNREELHER